MKKFFYLIFCMLPALATGQLQDVYFNNYSVQDGLSHTKVNSICQDEFGFMWFGTESGLNKFDGCTFIKYYSNYDSPGSLSGNTIEVIFNDNFGNFLIGSDKGLDIYNYKTDAFERFWSRAQDTLKYTAGSITAISLDTDERLWVGTTTGLILFEGIDLSLSTASSTESGPFRYVFSSRIKGLSDENVQSILTDRDGNIWVGTINGLNLISSRSEEIRQFLNDPNDPLTLSHNDVNQIFQSSDGSIWISTNRGGLNRINQDPDAQLSFTRYLNDQGDEFSISNNTVRNIIEGEDGYLWIGTFNGLNILDIKGEKFYKHFPDPLKPNSLAFKSVTSIYKDRAGSVWLGTYYGGIDFFDPRLNYFDSYQNNNHEDNSLSFNVISSMIEDKSGLIWIGTEGGGLNQFNKKAGDFSRINTLYKPGPDFSGTIISSLLEDEDGNLWIGTHRHGLHIADHRNKLIKELILPEQRPFISNRLNVTYALFQDSKGEIWIGTHGKGIFLYNKEHDQFQYFMHIPGENSISSDIINDFLEDENEVVWIATSNGLNRFNRKLQQFSRVNIRIPGMGEPAAEKDILVVSLFEDKMGQIWVGTFGDGLFKLDKENMALIPVSRDELAEVKVIYGIEEDSDNSLWLSTNMGIYQYDQFGLTRRFDIHDGIQSNQFSRNSILKCRDGDILFGSVRGLNMLEPGNVGMNEIPPEIFITDLFISSSSVRMNDKGSPLTAPVNEISEITLNHKQNDFGFQFVALNFILPEKNRYKYMLEGLDDGWLETGFENRHINYSNLKPGEYTFKILASNNDGIWTPLPKTITVHLSPAPWKTWWAFLMYTVIITLILLLILNLLNRKNKVQHELKLERYEKEKIEDINRLKLQFFTNISHEIRTPLTMIISPLEKILKDNPEAGIRKQLLFIQKSANRLYDLVNQLLDFRKIESEKLEYHVECFDLPESIDLISSHYEEYCRNEGIEFISELDPTHMLAFLDRKKFEKILWNLLSNAVKFTDPGGKIWFKSSIANDWIKITVKDNGAGIPLKEQSRIFERFYQSNSKRVVAQGTGIGLFLAKSFAEMSGGSISVESQPGKGSTFTVELPIRLPEGMESTESEEVAVYDEQKTTEYPDAPPVKEWSSHSSEMKMPLILIVEDEKDIRDYLCEIFGEQFRVICAPDGKTGYKLAHQRLPGIILSDFKMPGMDGIELCKKIKSDITTSHIPFILLSAYTEVENKIKGLQTGADDYIDKPFQIDVLKLKINNILKARLEVIHKYKRQFFFDPQKISSSPIDQGFLERAEKIVLEKYASSEFNPEILCKALNIGRTTLHVKLKALINQSTTEFIKTIRVREAINLMKENRYRISEIAYLCGFNSPHYFTYSFKQVTGLTPTEFLEKGEQS